MRPFIKLFIQEVEDTIYGLTGQRPVIKLLKIADTFDNSFSEKLVRTDFIGTKDRQGAIFFPTVLATSLGDMLLGGDGIGKDIISDDDKDCIREIVSNILGAINTELGKENILTSFKETSVSLYSDYKNFNFLFKQNYLFSFELGPIDSLIVLGLNSQMNYWIDIYDNKEFIDKNIKVENECKSELLINDILVDVKIVLGSKTLTLEELTSLTPGGSLELEQFVNDPLKLFVNNVPYAEGEIVVVDGMYGLMITKMYSKEDVYHV